MYDLKHECTHACMHVRIQREEPTLWLVGLVPDSDEKTLVVELVLISGYTSPRGYFMRLKR